LGITFASGIGVALGLDGIAFASGFQTVCATISLRWKSHEFDLGICQNVNHNNVFVWAAGNENSLSQN
jgi:hypothetical protein